MGPREVAAFHLVLEGACGLELDGAGASVELAEGDLVVLPTGAGHVARDDPASPVLWLDDLLGRQEHFDGTLRHGGDGTRTELLCGAFTVSGEVANPVLAMLPDVVHVDGRERWLRPMVQLVREELAERAPGVDTAVLRLTDVLLVQCVRRALAAGPPSRLRALKDREISRALALVHERPEHAWTVSELAISVALSRSAFAARFRELVGEPPMHYVRRCRLTRAAELLRSTSATLSEIAERSGYRSEVSLSKAFRRAFATSPGRYRASSPELIGS